MNEEQKNSAEESEQEIQSENDGIVNSEDNNIQQKSGDNPSETVEDEKSVVDEPDNTEAETPVVEETATEGPVAKEQSEKALPSDDPKSESDSDDEDISEHEDEGSDKELEEAEEDDLSTLSREELFAMLQTAAASDEPVSQRNIFNKARRAFIELTKKAKEEALESYLEAGGNKDDFDPGIDELDEKQRELNKTFRTKIQKVREAKENEKTENLRKKEEVLEGLKAIIQNEDDVMKAFDAVHEFQAQWRKIGNVPQAKAEHLWQSYRFYVSKFYDLIDLHKELRELDHKKNLEAKVQLCEQVESLLLETSINKAINTLRDIQEQWKDIGHVPKENHEEIWDRFKSSADRIYDNRRAHIEDRLAIQEQNYREKVSLCEKVEALVLDVPQKHGEWQKQMDALLAEQEAWKKTGRAPAAKNDEIWKRFKGTFDTFFKSRRAFFGEIRKEESKNLQIKMDLCVQAESVQESSEWKETSELLKKLQETWKNTGHVNYKQSETLWKRFRAACDHFFSRRSEIFAEQEKEFDVNLELKIKLIEKIESHAFANEKSKDLDALKEFQQEWLDIGRVPMKSKDKIYQRYKRALDKGYDQIRLSEGEKAQMNLNRKIERYKGNDAEKGDQREKGSLRNRIETLRSEITQLENNIGFFANSKGAEALKKPIEQKIETAKAELTALKALLKSQA